MAEREPTALAISVLLSSPRDWVPTDRVGRMISDGCLVWSLASLSCFCSRHHFFVSHSVDYTRNSAKVQARWENYWCLFHSSETRLSKPAPTAHGHSLPTGLVTRTHLTVIRAAKRSIKATFVMRIFLNGMPHSRASPRCSRFLLLGSRLVAPVSVIPTNAELCADVRYMMENMISDLKIESKGGRCCLM